MNKKIDNKGMTIVEVLVSVMIISLIMSLLFTLLLQVQKIESDNSKKSSLMISQNVITKAIEKDMIEIGVKAISTCEYSDFNIDGRVIKTEKEDGSKNYLCYRIEYNQSYDMADVGYLLIYQQSETMDNAAWVMRYGRGYYNECMKGQVPYESNWKETYSVVQKLEPSVDLILHYNEDNKVTYTAEYTPGKKYSDQITNNGNLFIPIQDISNNNYNIDLSFEFKLNYPTEETISNSKSTFVCSGGDTLKCNCTSNGSKCDKTSTTDLNYDSVNNKYIYTCSEEKESLGSVIGMNKNFIEMSNVIENGIIASKVGTVEFLSTDQYVNKYLKNGGEPVIRSSVDVSYSQNGTTVMYFSKNKSNDLYDLSFVQDNGVKVYGSSLANMFKNFTSLTSVDFQGFDTSGKTTMNSMFYNCKSLKRLTNFHKLDFSSINDLSSMFFKCSSLTSSPFHYSNGSEEVIVDLSSILYANSTFNESGLSGTFNYFKDFNAKNVVSLRMFLRKSKITSFILDANGEEMSNLSNMNSMLTECGDLLHGSFKNTIADKLTDMEYLYDFDGKLADSEFIDFITHNLTLMTGMFKNCESMTKFTFTNFDSSKVEFMTDMFKVCKKLVDVNLDGLKFDSVKYMTRMFSGCNTLKFLTFTNEDSDYELNLDNCLDMQDFLNGCLAFREFKGKHFTLKNVKTVEGFFYGAGAENINISLTDLELNNCTNLVGMLKASRFGSVDLSGIHSKVTDEIVNMTDFAKGASQLHYIFLNNAEFSTGVNLTEAFNACRRLTFVDGIDYNSKDSLDEYFGGKGEIVRKDGEYPFYNFMTSSGYATSLGSMFRDCTYLRGMPDGFLDGIHTNEKTTSYTQMFYNAFSETLLPSVTISEGDYYNIYQLVLPFTFENGNVLQTFMLADCGNLASITFKNVDTMTSAANFYMRQTQTLQGFGWNAYYNKRVNSLKVNLGNLKVYVPGSVGYDGYSYLFANFGGWLDSTDRQKTNLYTRDGIEGAPMEVTLSSNCSIAKHQYKYANWIFTDNSKGKVTFKGPSGCDYTTS